MEPTDLRRIRDGMRWTQIEAAARVGVTENTWARWERGQMAVHPARVSLLEKLAREATRREAKRAARAEAGASGRAGAAVRAVG